MPITRQNARNAMASNGMATRSAAKVTRSSGGAVSGAGAPNRVWRSSASRRPSLAAWSYGPRLVPSLGSGRRVVGGAVHQAPGRAAETEDVEGDTAGTAARFDLR